MQQTNEYNNKKKKTDIDNKVAVTCGEGARGNIRVGEWELQTIGCKLGYKVVLYNMGNIARIL